MSHCFRFGEFELDPARRELRERGRAVELQPKVFAVLALLVQNPERALGKDDFLEQVWSGRFVTENVLSRCVRQLRRLLRDDAAEPTFIRTVRGHGYQFNAPVDQVAMGGDRRLTRVAVLPFRPLLADATQPGLELGLADTLVNDLSRQSDLVVRPLSVVLDAGEGGTPADPVDLGRRLEVDVVVEGRLQIAQERVRISVRALRVADGRAVMSERFEEALTDLFTVQDRLSRSVMVVLAVQLATEPRPGDVRRATRSVEAYRAYVDGRLKLAQHAVPSIQSALEAFELAISLDEAYLEPLVGLAEANDLLATLGTEPVRYHEASRQAAERVIRIDPLCARAHTCLGKVAWQHDWQWERAEAQLRRATELDPADAEALIALSDFLCYQARYDEGLEAAERAGEINPFSPWVQSMITQALYMGGHAHEAVEQARRSVELAPDFGFARFFLGLSLCQVGEKEEGIQQLQLAVERTGRQDFVGALGFALARVGQVEAAQSVLEELLAAEERGSPVPPIAFAMLYAGLGRAEAALDYLGQVLAQRSWHILLLHADPGLAEIRARPEGLALLQAAGLPA
jgi:DNA-binding winged helix-turn-helix (wHTH) protein/tetratricopeptide (TPR) repeat protein